MKQYLLLRDNRETGPFSYDQISALDLFHTDLIWIESESTSWLNAGDVDKLRGIVQRRPIRTIITTASSDQCVGFSEIKDLPPVQEPMRERFIEDVDENLWTPGSVSFKNALKIAALFGGVVCGAFVMKMAADEFGNAPDAHQPPVAAVAYELPQSNPGFRDALVTEVVEAKEPVKKTETAAIPVDLRKQISLAGTDYKVGMLGGINGLSLNISNGSPHAVDKVVIAVEYMKKNGSVIHTDNYEVNDIKAHSRRNLQVPASKRGVKVAYRILDIRSAAHKSALRQV